jgi:Tfp pilus assembly protein PilF
MSMRRNIAFIVVTGGFLLVFPLPTLAAQKSSSGMETDQIRTPIKVTLIVRDTAGASLGLTPTVRVFGEAQDGTVYNGSPRNNGDKWIFEVPGLGTYTAEVSEPGYKTTQKLIAVTDKNENPPIDVTLEPEANRGKARGNTIMAPKARAELEEGKEALMAQHFDDAKLHLEKTLRLAPASPEANYYFGLLSYYTGNRNTALVYLQKVVSLDHENGPAFLALGEVYYLAKDYPHATNVLEQGLALEPDSWRAEAVLGSAYYRQADYEKGLEHAQKAVTIGRDEASGTDFLLGKCLAALGRRTEAIAAFEAFLKLQPASDLTSSAERMLKELRAARAIPTPLAPP